MTGAIKIRNLRNIVLLDFDLPKPGAWVLTAANGAGKTSLLACLRRIGHPNAFPIHFPSSNESEQLDNYEDASIIYEVGDEQVEYAYRGERWTPRPRRNSALLSKFGYPSVIYVGANAERITPRPEDFKPVRVKPATPFLIQALNQIFETEKFDELKTINLTTGNGSKAFVLRVGQKKPTHYHSEKQFSLGELCVLKLISALQTCPNLSLVLIDELEMALHPRAQIKLFEFLSKMASEKSLTVVFSTHSVSLLKRVPRQQIILLERDSQESVRVVRGCFATYAIGNITIGEERAPDSVLYVEDDVARGILEPLIKLVLQKKYAANNLFPSVKAIPIGGYEQVVAFLSQHSLMLPKETKCHAVLDADVKEETIADWKKRGVKDQLDKFEKLSSKIDYLPWTPEVGILSYFSEHRTAAEKALKETYNDNSISLSKDQFDILKGLAGSERRKASKKVFTSMCENLHILTGKSFDVVQQDCCSIFAKHYFDENTAKVMQLLGNKVN